MQRIALLDLERNYFCNSINNSRLYEKKMKIIMMNLLMKMMGKKLNFFLKTNIRLKKEGLI
jgi:hypothetical protein